MSSLSPAPGHRRDYRDWLRWGLPLLDTVLINLAFATAYWLRYERELFRPLDELFDVPYRAYLPVAAGLTALIVLGFKLERVYDRRRGASWLDDLYAIFLGALVGTAVVVVILFGLRPTVYSRLILLYAFVLTVFYIGASRLALHFLLDWLRRRGRAVDRVVIVGAGEIGRAVMRNIVAEPTLGYQVLGFFDDDPKRGGTDIGRFKALGHTLNLQNVLRRQAVDEVIITLPSASHRRIMELISICERHGVRPRIVPDLFQMALARVEMDEINGIPLLGMRKVSIRGWNLAAKRALDVAVAGPLLVLLSPLLVLIALLVRLESDGPVLFRQVRVGRGGQPFTLLKFRSMRSGADREQLLLAGRSDARGPIFKMRDDPRRTRLGRLLRRTSLDELPQLWNVLRGEMSLVGPRPPLPSEVQRYEEWHKRRLEVAPGLTGLWQVSGRSNLTFDEMVMLDLYYGENWSLWLDLKIILKTIPTMVMGTGAY